MDTFLSLLKSKARISLASQSPLEATPRLRKRKLDLPAPTGRHPLLGGSRSPASIKAAARVW